jgi:glycosyltransferase involved in cell wall biosynthesis
VAISSFTGGVEETIVATVEKSLATVMSKPRKGCTGVLLRVRLKEYFSFDSFVFRNLIALLSLGAGAVLTLCGQRAKAFRIFSRIHRAAYCGWVSKTVEWWAKDLATTDRGATKPIAFVCDRYLDELSSTPSTAKFHDNPAKLLGTRVLVLKSPAANEKGVVLIDYTFSLSLFAKKFDVARIAERYYLVLEPTWSGYYDLDILCYSKFNFPVFVQTPEPRDAATLRTIGGNLIPLSVGGNWWVDHRVYRPLPDVTKDVDVIMVACWGTYKRHYSFFSSLATLRKQGHLLKAVLVGYRANYKLDDILLQAQHFGVEDQLEAYENLTPDEVNRQYNRAKVNLLWSRKEGFNRAIIEGMCANVPCIIRVGHNYGHAYSYINPLTGCFSSERDLPQKLLGVIGNPTAFAPRDWVLQNMSCLQATEDLQAAIKQVATAAGENWTQNLAVKTCYLNTMRYWDEDNRRRFEPDYEFIRSVTSP